MTTNIETKQSCYTAITFAPVQGFIEKSRKLRDLYGSSYLLSYLAWIICNMADKYFDDGISHVVSPALPNITQGMPNQIIIEGDFPEKEAELALNKAWECVVKTCQEWIEENVTSFEDEKVIRTVTFNYTPWKRSWSLWKNYAWEFFWVQGCLKEEKPGEGISYVRKKLNEKKRGRNWTGINWQGESSTLSGADAIAYPKLGKIADPREYNYQQERQDVTDFYQALSKILGESFIDPREELSIPELIKRIITYKSISEKLISKLKIKFAQENLEELFEQITEKSEELKSSDLSENLSKDLSPSSFKDLSRHKDDKSFQGWFQGDGDKAGDYLIKYPERTHAFSKTMRNWGKWFHKRRMKMGRVIYAGGDDFLGIFYDKENTGEELKPKFCVDWLSKFKPEIWHGDKVKPITVSVGFVWAFPGIPQRDVLQHCREAEKSAKSNGRDRIAFRVLFNNGNYLEWVCPWWLLEAEAGLLSSYQDREGKQNWTHIYGDVAVLESRHSLGRRYTNDDEDNPSCKEDTGIDVALPLFKIYFPKNADILQQDNFLWNRTETKHEKGNEYNKLIGGILGERKSYYRKNTEELDQNKVDKALTNWIINLAKVGFHLCQQ